MSQILWTIAEWLTLGAVITSAVYFVLMLVNGIIEQVRKL